MRISDWSSDVCSSDLEIAERLEHRDLQAVVAHHAADLLRRPVEGEEVGLEDLDAVEARRRDGGKLLVEIATDRYRRDRGLHCPPPAVRKRTDVSRPAGYRLVRRSAAPCPPCSHAGVRVAPVRRSRVRRSWRKSRGSDRKSTRLYSSH